MNPVLVLVLAFIPQVVHTQDCVQKGMTYANGESWLSDAGCKRFTCTDGNANEEPLGCPYQGECMAFDTAKENYTTCKVLNCTRSGMGYRLTNSANGCIDENNQCHPIGSEWIVDKCIHKTCEYVSEGVVQDKLVLAGCPYEDKCLSVGEKRKPSLCIEEECQLSGLVIGLQLISGGCEDNGTCRDEGTKWTNNCIEYECQKVSNGFKPEPIVKDCMFRDECKKDGTTWMDGCFEYKCTNGLFHLLKGECQGRDGCFPVGAEWKEDSITYTCTKNGNSYAKVAVRDETGELKGVGCTVDGKTRSIGEVWDEGCFKKTCKKYDDILRTEVVSGQCMLENGTCIPVGTVVEDNCYTYQCKQESDVKYTADLLDIKCRSRENGKDICLKNGESSYVSGCTSRVCTVDMVTKSWKLDVNAECVFKSGSGQKCIPKNDFGVNDRCVKYKCEVTQQGKQTRAQMKKVEVTGCPIKDPTQLKRYGDVASAVIEHCAELGDAFTDRRCMILKCQGNKRMKRLRKTGKAKGC